MVNHLPLSYFCSGPPCFPQTQVQARIEKTLEPALGLVQSSPLLGPFPLSRTWPDWAFNWGRVALERAGASGPVPSVVVWLLPISCWPPVSRWAPSAGHSVAPSLPLETRFAFLAFCSLSIPSIHPIHLNSNWAARQSSSPSSTLIIDIELEEHRRRHVALALLDRLPSPLTRRPTVDSLDPLATRPNVDFNARRRTIPRVRPRRRLWPSAVASLSTTPWIPPTARAPAPRVRLPPGARVR